MSTLDFEVKFTSRLDKALREQGELSVAKAKDLIKSGFLKVNGFLVKKPAFEVRAGDRITCDTAVAEIEKPPQKPRAPITIDIIWEDEYFVAMDKPTGMLSVPTSHSKERSAQDFIEEYLTQKEPVRHANAVHRLDREASGALMFAKDIESRDALMELFKKRKVKKVYLAVTGTIDESTPESGEIDVLIEDNRPHSKVLVGEGKPAVTEYEILARSDSATLVHAHARTGRRHQVRVHLAQKLAPIVGDEFYGGSGGKRLMLHCEKIQFNHPITGEAVKITAAIPPGFEI